MSKKKLPKHIAAHECVDGDGLIVLGDIRDNTCWASGTSPEELKAACENIEAGIGWYMNKSVGKQIVF